MTLINYYGPIDCPRIDYYWCWHGSSRDIIVVLSVFVGLFLMFCIFDFRDCSLIRPHQPRATMRHLYALLVLTLGCLVALAWFLLHKPKAAIIDEPTVSQALFILSSQQLDHSKPCTYSVRNTQTNELMTVVVSYKMESTAQ